MPIQTNRLEKSKFRSTQAANFSGLLRIAVHQTFKCTVPTQNVPESCKFRVRKWFCENIGYLEIGTNTGQFDVSTKALIPHKVVKFSNMLRSLVVHRILRNLDASLVVLHDGDTTTGNIKVLE